MVLPWEFNMFMTTKQMYEQALFLPIAVDRKGITYSINTSNQQDAVHIVEQINREAKSNQKIKIVENNGTICLFSTVDNLLENPV